MRAHTQVCAHNIYILEKCGTLVSKQAKVAEVLEHPVGYSPHSRVVFPAVEAFREWAGCGSVGGFKDTEYVFSHFLGFFRISLVGRRYLYRPTSIAR